MATIAPSMARALIRTTSANPEHPRRHRRRDDVQGERPARNGSESVVICGAGAAGLAAALAAARAGADVSLVEARPRLGGTVTHALIHTLGGFLDSSGEFLNDGLARELAEALSKADTSVHRRHM